jgi:hypothetical protein
VYFTKSGSFRVKPRNDAYGYHYIEGIRLELERMNVAEMEPDTILDSLTDRVLSRHIEHRRSRVHRVHCVSLT